MDPLLHIFESDLQYVRQHAQSQAHLLDWATLQMLEVRRLYCCRRLIEQVGHRVLTGLLRGYALPDVHTWRSGDVAAKLLGLYEKEVQDRVAVLTGTSGLLINIGAADGFYGIGLVERGVFQRSILYEISEASRLALAASAEALHIAGAVAIKGAAHPGFAAELQVEGYRLEGAVVLMDIEGAEFDVLTRECLHALRGTHVIVEIHDFMRGPNARADLARLIDDAQLFFDIDILTTGARDPAAVPALRQWSDSDRWLVCSEGRARHMQWLHLIPRPAA